MFILLKKKDSLIMGGIGNLLVLKGSGKYDVSMKSKSKKSREFERKRLYQCYSSTDETSNLEYLLYLPYCPRAYKIQDEKSSARLNPFRRR